STVRSVWRFDHRRTRRRRREEDDDGGDVRGTRSGDDAAGALCFRSPATFKSGQDVPAHSTVRGENWILPAASVGGRGGRAVLLRHGEVVEWRLSGARGRN